MYTGELILRYYKGKHYNEIVDLYGGKYFIDDSRMNVKYKADDNDWQNKELKKGDIVYRDYDGYMMQEGFFAQGEYNRDALSAVCCRVSFKYNLLAERSFLLFEK